MSHVVIDWDDLSEAFHGGSTELRHYFDRETGKVITLTDEMLQYAESPPDDTLPEWMHDGVSEAAQILNDCCQRYIQVPASDTAEEYRDMETFISTVGSSRLQGELWRAIRGSGAFRRFKDVLLINPQEKERWFAFRESQTLTRMNKWLARLNIEPTNPLQPPTIPATDGHDSDDEAAERQELVEELTLLLLYLCSWDENSEFGGSVRKAWKGYTFDTLNALEDRGLIHQSRKAKSVALTEEGIHLARELEMRFKP